MGFLAPLIPAATTVGGAGGVTAAATSAAGLTSGGLLSGLTLGGLAKGALIGVSALGALSSANQQIDFADAQAAQLEAAAEREKVGLALRDEERRIRLRRLRGAQRAAAGVGGDPNTGSALDIGGSTAFASFFEDFGDRFNTDLAVGDNRASAANVRASGRNRAAGTILDFGAQFI